MRRRDWHRIAEPAPSAKAGCLLARYLGLGLSLGLSCCLGAKRDYPPPAPGPFPPKGPEGGGRASW
jgi:hypothetical protein